MPNDNNNQNQSQIPSVPPQEDAMIPPVFMTDDATPPMVGDSTPPIIPPQTEGQDKTNEKISQDSQEKDQKIPMDQLNPSPQDSNPTNPPPGSAAPTDDIQSSIDNLDSKPKKKFGGGKGKYIATILGILLLIGGLGAGVVLVKQQQDIREKADDKSLLNYKGNINTAVNQQAVQQDEDASSYDKAKTQDNSYAKGDINEAVDKNKDASSYDKAKTQDNSYADGNINEAVDTQTTQGCIANCVRNGQTPDTCGLICDRKLSADTTTYLLEPETGYGDCNSQFPRYGARSQDGAEQACISHCKIGATTEELNTYDCNTVGGQVAAIKGGAFCYSCPGEGATTLTSSSSTTGGGNGSTSSAICYNIKAYDTSWNQLTTAQLASSKAGDVIRFTVSGQATTGSFTKARFTINGVSRSEVTNTKPGSNPVEFYDEYTIPEGIATFSVSAQVYHDSLGWK